MSDFTPDTAAAPARIGFFSPLGMDVARCSGTPLYIQKSLQKIIPDLISLPVLSSMRLQALHVRQRLRNCLRSGRYPWYYHTDYAQEAGRLLGSAVERYQLTALITVFAMPWISGLSSGIPVISIEDATFAGYPDYNPGFLNLAPQAISEGHAIEAAALKRAARICYSNQWARTAALAQYHPDTSKTGVIPFGANLPEFCIPGSENGVRIPPVSPIQPCRLLLVGNHAWWKGVDRAVQVLDGLNSTGVPATLTICGCGALSELANRPDITVIPFLRKDRPEELAELVRLYRESDLFLLPTRSECCAIVFAEAMAFGLPVITTRIGGNATAVQTGQTGVLIDSGWPTEDVVTAIRDIWQDPVRYAGMSRASRQYYESTLNWAKWQKEFQTWLQALNLL